ncbi:AraC family transcriptional regulator [Paenibacillus sp. JX-17]|uniref:AraC family transcriptional regulator n=1 Tax=Paenibacillus lacisoli TaxID=3064525 RepID=A0ABT9CCU9_9BACL|nr:AraC family transcriptional regulator [Paenibacillus sp. JX-17]MDO7906700.1 AraC family transcriptional regulator [Paenibacillus sp. JX-17]
MCTIHHTVKGTASAPVQLPLIHIVGDIAKKAGSGLGPRTIPDYELLYFPDASRSIYRIGDQAYTLDEPSFVLTRPGESHTYEYDIQQPARHLFIHFGLPDTHQALELLPMLRPGEASVIPVDDQLLVGMMKQILYISYAYPTRLQERGSAMLLTLLTELNGQLYDDPVRAQIKRLPSQIVKALDYIDEHIEEPIAVEMLANRSGWSHEHFSRSFMQYLGRTPRETIIQRRIERACQLLLYEEWSIKEVAYHVGFADENYFSRLFKTVKGMTATEYRRRYNNPVYRNLVPVKETETLYPANRILFNVHVQ